jgi:hypothetical protein
MNPYTNDAQYAELTHDDKIQMFYKEDLLDKYLPNAPIIWYYLSYCNLWQGASSDMTKKRLLKIVD